MLTAVVSRRFAVCQYILDFLLRRFGGGVNFLVFGFQLSYGHGRLTGSFGFILTPPQLIVVAGLIFLLLHILYISLKHGIITVI